MASLHFRTGQALYLSNQYARARPVFAAAGSLLERACADEPNNIAARLLLARTYSFLAYQERDLDCHRPAAEWFERSAQIYEKHLMPLAKTETQFRSDYAGTLRNLALARRRLGDEAGAAAALTKALEELHPALAYLTDVAPANPGSSPVREHLVNLHLTLARLQRDRSDRTSALRALSEARRLSMGHGRNLYRVASDLALCAGADEDTKRLTMDVLREAVAAGFRNLPELLDDEDFVAFRERDDFRHMVREMEEIEKRRR